MHFDTATRIFGLKYNRDDFSFEDAKHTVSELGNRKKMPYSMEIVDL